jgi:hypothetical protein
MADPFATPDQLASRLGVTFDAAEEARATLILEDVSAEIRDVAGVDWAAEGGELEDVPPVVTVIALRTAKRAWFERPFDSENIGDYAYRQTPHEHMIRTSDRKTLRRLGGLSSVGTIGLSGIGIADVIYVPVSGGGDWLPWE